MTCISTRTTSAQPATPARPVVDTYHGVSVTDAYRWLEHDKADEVQQWSDAQNAYARSILDKLPGVEAIRARVTEIMSKRSPSYGSVVFRGGKYYALKDQPPKQQPMVVVLASLDDVTTARVIVDPNVIDATGATAIDWFIPSPDGKLVAVSMSVGGTEAGDTHIFDAATGREVHEVVPHTNSGTAGGDLAWSPDGKGFYYTRHPWPGEKAENDRGFYQQVYYHALGTPAKDDRSEMGRDLPRIAEIQLDVDDRTGRVLASVQNGDGGEFAHFLREAGGAWKQFTKFDQQIDQVVFGKRDDLFLISFQDAPRGKIGHLAIADLGQKEAATIVPQADDTIVTSFMEAPSIAVTPNRLYLTYQLGGPSEIRGFDHQGKPLKKPEQLPLSDVYDFEPLTGDDLLFGSASYLQPPAKYVFRAADGATRKTALATESPVNFDDCEVVREFATSKDGTRVPVNIIRKKGTRLDGTNPCIVTGYGGYGISIAPRFSAVDRVFIDHGFVLAEANIRGGGEFGEKWHLEGNLTKKQNVFDDFAAACQHMIDRKYTSRERLGIVGGSNGGLLMGAVFTQHPDLAKAVVSHVGIYDSLRTELSPNGEFNITEFGTVKNPDQFKAMYAYSPYHHVTDGTRYPAILFMTGANDPRVEPMQSRKMTARLQAAKGGDAPVLLRTSSGGHGGSTPLSERIEQNVDEIAFFFKHLGVQVKSAN
jgi:prolyl oligopeptidase